MKNNFTIEERQKVYEQLLVLSCPDALAALIAERVDINYIFENGVSVTKDKIQSWIVEGFDWWETPEGFDFWNYMYDCVLDFEEFVEEGVDYTLPVAREYTVPTVAETIDGTTFEMYTDCNQKPLPLWTKVKLFLGKWVYRA